MIDMVVVLLNRYCTNGWLMILFIQKMSNIIYLVILGHYCLVIISLSDSYEVVISGSSGDWRQFQA